jgi:hypothetical protein
MKSKNSHHNIGEKMTKYSKVNLSFPAIDRGRSKTSS